MADPTTTEPAPAASTAATPAPPDYTRLLDAEMRAFIARTLALTPADAVGHSIEEQRRSYDAMARSFHAGYPPEVQAETTGLQAPGRAIPLRIYRHRTAQAAAVVLYFHGGGFILGGLESHDDVCAEICAATGFEVVSVDYRLLPEHPHPAAYDDCLAAFHHVAGNWTQPLLLCGDSAGGNLAAAVAHATRAAARPASGMVLIYPSLGARVRQGSYLTHAHAPLLSTSDVDYFEHMRAGEERGRRDVTLAPLDDDDYARLPPAVIVSAECDPLSEDGRLYCERLRAAGGKAVWFNEAGLVHGYLRARHSSARARESFARITGALGTLGRGAWDWA